MGIRAEQAEEQAAWEWFFNVACPHLDPTDDSDQSFAAKQCLEEEFEALCDAAQEAAN